ncbi:MAG: hypothetical protein ABT10_24835 [Novosphingobium sp. SCN 63-17]|nr:MAG: hypothetical protein ABT10_24835 [Novosphingobium sp. SCN 63-17]
MTGRQAGLPHWEDTERVGYYSSFLSPGGHPPGERKHDKRAGASAPTLTIATMMMTIAHGG